jgi:hypothetical protein
MKLGKIWIVLLTVTGLAVAVVIAIRANPESSIAGMSGMQKKRVSSLANNNDASSVVTTVMATNAVASKNNVSFSRMFHDSPNYLIFSRTALTSAKAGDADAQYYLGKALWFCDLTYRMYFKKNGQLLGLDEALVRSAAMHRSNSFTQSIYDRCHDLEEAGTGQFGSADEWFNKAAAANQPVAQATVAFDALAHESVLPNVQTTEVAPIDGASTSQVPKVDPRALLVAAAKSGDPEALWNIGLAQGYLAPNYNDKLTNQLAWWLVSCQRGLDCSTQADWLQIECPFDKACPPGTTGMEFLHNSSAGNWTQVEQRAQQLNAELNAGQWDDLGLGS